MLSSLRKLSLIALSTTSVMAATLAQAQTSGDSGWWPTSTQSYIGLNAGRSADGISHIEIGVRSSRAWVLLDLSDRGPGVPADQLHQLTRPYFRAQAAQANSRSSPQGSGLGLAIVERSVQRMGGTFSIFNNSTSGLMALMKFKWIPSVDP